MDPFSMGAASIATSVIGGGLSAFGAVGQGEAAQNQANYQAGIAKVNSLVDKQNASWALESGGVEGLKSGQKTGFQIGQIRVDQGASGVDVNTGSSKQVVDSQRIIGQLDQSIIATSAARRAYGFNVEAAGKDAESTMDIVTGVNAEKAGELGAITSILGTASSVSNKWLQGKTAGIWGA